ncbi:MAG TPA: hypothetical protein VGQ51_16080, partial [Puia sp.]|nr:hypothetical protein [Puia sp.]
MLKNLLLFSVAASMSCGALAQSIAGDQTARSTRPATPANPANPPNWVDKAGDPVDYVNPLMGTQSTYELSSGNTYPSIGLPWGMNFWTPQTGKNGDGWQYTYTVNKIRGLKQTHQPSPWMNDYGEFSI